MKCLLIVLSLISVNFAELKQEDYEAFVSGNKIFSGRIYKELASGKEENLLISPFSVQIALAVVQAGAKGVTEEEIHTQLNLLSNTAKSAYHGITRDQLLRNTPHYNLTTANKIYVKAGFEINADYKKDVTENYNAPIENINFVKNEEAAASMNKWVEDQTNNKIKNLISPLALSEDTRLIIINALYFQGKWNIPFDLYATTKKNFYKSKKDVVQVDTMQSLDVFNYYDSPELGAKFLELPYKSDNKDISMVIVLPNEVDGLKQLESNIEKIYDVPKLSPERVSVQIPKFSIETTIKFIDVLKKLGVKAVFSESADLSGISGPPGQLVVSEVIQKNFINVTEEGTEAASSTAVIVEDRVGIVSPNPTVNFTADHPFLFYINLKQVVLFQGRYLRP